MFNKRADISLNFLAGLIVSVIGFSILLFVYYQLAFGGEIDRQVCHTSIITRATIPLGEGFVPLKCHTAKICITGNTFSKGECEEFENEKSVISMRVSDSQNSLSKIEKIYAQEILSCWNTMGEGRVSFSSQAVVDNFGVGNIYSSCVICSRIAIDKKSFDNVDFSKMDVYKYMSERIVPESDKTYLQHITNNPNNVGITLTNLENLGNSQIEGVNLEGLEVSGSELGTEGLYPDETAVIFMQISSPDHWSSFRNTLGIGATTAAGSAVVTGGKSLKWTWSAARSLGRNPIIAAAIAVVGVGYQQGSVAWNRAVSASFCGDVSIGSEARSGCSVVRTTNYNVKDILEYCQVIESIP